jgi:hypothetical protein
MAPAASADNGRWGRHGGHNNNSEAKELLTGLSSPKGIDTFLGQPVVAQGAFGPPGPVLIHLQSFFGSHTFEVTEPLNLVDIAIAHDGSAWLLGADFVLYRKTFWGDPQPVANIAEYQLTDPDPDNQADDPSESNPYGLAVLPNGDALVADAAGNDVLRVTKRGDISTFARFAPELISTDHIPGFPAPFIDSEAVPTSIAVGRDGVYVGQLQGFPFRPGTSEIYKIPFWADGAVCDTDGPSKDCKVAVNDLTSIQDIALDKWSGKFYVYELAEEGAGAFEEGFETGVFPPAVLLEVRGDHRRELAAGQLSQPGGVTVGLFGKVFVTDGMFSDGRLLTVKT